MKANELMIGDWVMYNGNIFIDDEYEPSVPIEPKQIDSGEDIDLAIEGCYTPIPLTPEILEKNGWEWASHRCDEKGTMDNMFYRCVGHIYFHSNGYAEADIIGYGMGYNGNGKFRGGTNYVHLLQHALRLCGLNELADNFIIQ